MTDLDEPLPELPPEDPQADRYKRIGWRFWLAGALMCAGGIFEPTGMLTLAGIALYVPSFFFFRKGWKITDRRFEGAMEALAERAAANRKYMVDCMREAGHELPDGLWDLDWMIAARYVQHNMPVYDPEATNWSALALSLKAAYATRIIYQRSGKPPKSWNWPSPVAP